MNLNMLALQFAPLVIYLLVDTFKGFRAGVYAAIATSILGVGLDYGFSGEFDQMLLGESVFVILLGSVSLKMNNDRYFKFQPTVVAWIFSLIFAYFQAFDQPLLLRYMPHMEKIFLNAKADPEAESKTLESPMLAALHDPATLQTMGRLSFGCIWLFLGHGLIMAYAALRLSTRAWLGWRLAIYPALLVMVVFYQVVR